MNKTTTIYVLAVALLLGSCKQENVTPKPAKEVATGCHAGKGDCPVSTQQMPPPSN